MSPKARPRFKGRDAALHGIMSTYIHSSKALYYNTTGRREAKYLVRAKAFILAIQGFQENLAVTKIQMERVLKRIGTDKKFFSDENELQTWIIEATKRIRAILSDARRGLQQNRTADWVIQIFGQPTTPPVQQVPGLKSPSELPAAADDVAATEKPPAATKVAATEKPPSATKVAATEMPAAAKDKSADDTWQDTWQNMFGPEFKAPESQASSSSSPS